MNNLIVSCVFFLASMAPCAASVMSFGVDSGRPGDRVSFSLSIDPSDTVTNFECTFEYDTNLLTLDDISLSSGAEDNGIFRLRYSESSSGRVNMETESWGDEWWLDDISRLAILTFVVSSSARSTTTHVRFNGPAYYEVDDDGYWRQASSTIDGVITIVAPGPTPTPTPPHGKSPEISLRMETTNVLTYGEEPVAHFSLKANDWSGYGSDAYMVIVLPGGQLYYRTGDGQLVTKQTPMVRNLAIGDGSGDIPFPVLERGLPPGLYTICSTLSYRGKNPLKGKNRISNLEDTQFELIDAHPTPAP